MITIYRPEETDFSRNGLGTLDNHIIDPIVKEELNGLYMLTFKYPIFAPRGTFVTGGYVIKAMTPKGYQLFRIHREAPSMGYTDITAYHIFYDLAFNYIDDTNVVNKSGTAAGNQILGATNYLHSFEFVSDIATVANARIVGMNAAEALLDDSKDNTFISRWGGEIDRDNFQIRMLREVGENRGVVIEYKKDLIAYEADIDWSTVVTRIKPIGFDGLELPEVFIDSPLIAAYPQPKVAEIEYKDIKAAIGEYADDEDAIPLEDAYAELRRLAGLEYSQGEIDRPTSSYKVEFAPLLNTKQYQQYAALQRIYIGDKVGVKHVDEGVDLTAKVISYQYNPMNYRYTEVTLGSVSQTLSGSAFNKIQSQIDQIKQVELSNLEKSIDRATGLLTTALGGYVLKRNGELLIMDTEDVTTAQKIWRWNLNGLGYSGTGYAGPYRTAITNDGHIVADFIDVGLLKAEMIQAGFNGISEGVTMDASGLKAVSATGDFSVVEEGGMRFYTSANVQTGSIESAYLTSEGSNGVGIFIEDGKFLNISRKNGSGVYESYLRIPYDENVVELYKLLNMGHQQIRYISTALFQSSPTSNGGKVFDANGTLAIGGYDGTSIGWMNDSEVLTTVMQFLYQEMRAFGTLNMNGNTITNQSDIRLKKNVVDATVDAYNVLEKMRFIEFEWDETNPYNERKPEGIMFGIEAQYSPFLAVKDVASNYLSIDMGKQVNLNSLALKRMLGDVQALQAENETLKQELADLKALLSEKGVI